MTDIGDPARKEFRCSKKIPCIYIYEDNEGHVYAKVTGMHGPVHLVLGEEDEVVVSKIISNGKNYLMNLNT